MRILSDFHDYYDAVQATGQDQTLVYYRKREEIEIRDYPLPAMQQRSAWLDRIGLQVRQHIIGFCGKVYPSLVLTRVPSKKSAICYTLDDVDRFFDGNYRKKEGDEYRTGTRNRWHGLDWPSDVRRDAFKEHLTECAAKTDSFVALFLEKRCPLFVGTVSECWWRGCSGKIVYNACLKDLEFFRLFDTYSAFQEIAMFLGGLAVPLKDIPKVPDKIMVGAKGFDKWSFRKPPREKECAERE